MPTLQDGSEPAPSAPRVWAVGGGKGGVGKSVVSTNLAVRVAQKGLRVVLIDGDLGGANLDTLLGCERPPHTLSHFFTRNVAALGDLAVATGIEGLSLIAGDADTLGAANPDYTHKVKLLRHLRLLDCDVVLLDLGAGTTFNTLDLYLAADLGLVVTTPEPTSVQNCFAFIKSATLRDLERRTGVRRRAVDHNALRSLAYESDTARAAMARTTQLVVNRAMTSEAQRVGNLLHDLAGRFLGGRVRLRGAIPDDAAVRRSIRLMRPVSVTTPRSRAALEIDALATELLRDQGHTEAAPVASKSGIRRAGLNEEFVLAGQKMHLQSEDLGAAQRAVRTQVFSPTGEVIYSRKTPYTDPFFRRLGPGDPDRVGLHHRAIRAALQQGRIQLRPERKSA